MKRLLAALSIVLAAGCATAPVETFSALPFDAAEYSALPSAGTGIVRGQVFATLGGGALKTGAGKKVVLFPATKYGDQRYSEQIIGGKLLTAPQDSRYMKNVFSKIADGDGRYEFSNIPPGQYYVYSEVTWAGDSEKQGGLVARKIDVENETVTEAMLSR